ncbi:MAG TPA: hypothetical protein VLC94_04090 [Candidatus Acidoferrum sp.]|nr:hypothetical protein [Candidatus Acidoferrum sp.]
MRRIVNSDDAGRVLIYDQAGAVGGESGAMAAAGRMRFGAAGEASVNEAARVEHCDEELVRAAQRGDRAAYGALYQRYARMVHGILLARVPRAAAEDLLQDVFCRRCHGLVRCGRLRGLAGGWR